MLQEIKSRTNLTFKYCFLPIQSNPSLVSTKRLSLYLFSSCAHCTQQDHYKTLGLKQNATANQIKSRFYELSRTHHPDMNPSDSSSADQFKQMSEAYNVLSDRNLRNKYDQTIKTSYSGTYASMSPDYSTGNATRRQNANYAWSTRRSRTNIRSEPGGRNDPLSGNTSAEEFLATLNRFERLARRKKLTPSTSSSHNSIDDPWLQSNPSTSKPNIHKASAAKQTIQLAFMLSFIFWIGTKFQM